MILCTLHAKKIHCVILKNLFFLIFFKYLKAISCYLTGEISQISFLWYAATMVVRNVIVVHNFLHVQPPPPPTACGVSWNAENVQFAHQGCRSAYIVPLWKSWLRACIRSKKWKLIIGDNVDWKHTAAPTKLPFHLFVSTHWCSLFHVYFLQGCGDWVKLSKGSMIDSPTTLLTKWRIRAIYQNVQGKQPPPPPC